ncbi:MAG: ATP synthase F0 subunit B [Desulfovibrio sp.]|nr:ATP synthase F0 subunit B [Desulfovibrio sp.]
MLDLNITLVFQLFNFIIAIFFLNILLIRPIREIIKKRDAIMNGLAAEADAFHAEATQKLSDYEAKLAGARQEAGKNREEGKNAGLLELQAIVGEAQQSAKQLLEENRSRLHSQADQALAELRDGIDNFSTKLGQKLVGN